MKKLFTLFCLVAIYSFSYGQYFVKDGVSMFVKGGTDLYTNDDFVNEGQVTFESAQPANFYLDGSFNNSAASGTIAYNDVTFYIGNGTVRSSDPSVSFVFKPRNPATQLGEIVKFVVLDKVSGTATVTGNISVANTLLLNDGDLIADGSGISGHMTLLNRTATDAAQILESANSTGNVRVEVERYMRPRRAFRFYASGVTSSETIRQQLQEGATAWNDSPFNGFGTHITGLSPDPLINTPGLPAVVGDGTGGLDWQPSGDASMFEWNNTTQQWVNTLITDPTILEVNKPYRIMVRGDRTLDITDNEIPTANPTATVLRSRGEVEVGSVPATLASNANNVSFVTNPYVARLDYTDPSIVKTNLNEFIAVWDVTLGGTPTVGSPGGRGGFVVLSGTNSATAPDPAGSTATAVLEPGQAFFVRASAASPTLTFNEAAKATSSAATGIMSSVNYLNLTLKESATSENAIDGTGFRFSDAYNVLADSNDGEKYENPHTNFGIVNGNSLLYIDNRPAPVGEVVVPLLFSGHISENYAIVPGLNLDGLNVEPYLRDNYLNTLTPINHQEAINISVDESILASVNPFRFEVVFNPTTLSVDGFDNGKFTLYPNPASDVVNVLLPENSTSDEWNVKLFSITGQLVNQWRHSDVNTSISLDISGINAGVYFVELSNNEQSSTQKLIKK